MSRKKYKIYDKEHFQEMEIVHSSFLMFCAMQAVLPSSKTKLLYKFGFYTHTQSYKKNMIFLVTKNHVILLKYASYILNCLVL